MPKTKKISEQAISGIDDPTITLLSKNEYIQLVEEVEEGCSWAQTVASRDFKNIPKLDLIVALSARANLFNGATDETRKFEEQHSEPADLEDSRMRLLKAVELAKHNNKKFTLSPEDYVPIFFNGSVEQNQNLREIVKNRELDYPAAKVIIDELPPKFVSTIGQSLSVQKYVEEKFESPPTLAIVTSDYHLKRALQTFGCDSPLLGTQFFENSPAILTNLPQVYQDLALTPNRLLKHATLVGVGADNGILKRPGAIPNLLGDMQGSVRYGRVQIPPSIAPSIPPNVLNFSHSLCRMGLHMMSFLTNHNRREKNQLCQPLNNEHYLP
jgi:hypothetical protein